MAQLQDDKNCSHCGGKIDGHTITDDNKHYCFDCKSFILKLDNIEKECKLLQSKIIFDFSSPTGFTEKKYITELGRLYDIRENYNDHLGQLIITNKVRPTVDDQLEDVRDTHNRYHENDKDIGEIDLDEFLASDGPVNRKKRGQYRRKLSRPEMQRLYGGSNTHKTQN